MTWHQSRHILTACEARYHSYLWDNRGQFSRVPQDERQLILVWSKKKNPLCTNRMQPESVLSLRVLWSLPAAADLVVDSLLYLI